MKLITTNILHLIFLSLEIIRAALHSYIHFISDDNSDWPEPKPIKK